MSKRLNLSNFPPDMMYRLLTTVLFGNATTSFFRAQLRKLRGCARLGLTVIGNQKSKNQSRRGFQRFGVEIVAKRIEHRLYQTPSDLEFRLGLAEKPHREPHSIAAGRVPVCQLNIGPQIVQRHHDIGQCSRRKIWIQTCQRGLGARSQFQKLSPSVTHGLRHEHLRLARGPVYLHKPAANQLTVVEAVVATKGSILSYSYPEGSRADLVQSYP